MSVPSLETVKRALGSELGRTRLTYDERDVALYALGIGAPNDPFDMEELRLVYELSSLDFQVFPTFAVTFGNDLLGLLLTGEIAGIKFNPMMLVHGEQELELFRPLPPATTVLSNIKIADIFDKGSGMLIIFDIESFGESGERLALARTSVFIRGLGGFGGKRGTSSKMDLPNRPPDCVVQETTLNKQALLYRLSGDTNPLHADPQMAAIGGYDKPILHGLCTFGYAARAILQRFGNNAPSRLRSIRARFVQHVFPGETLKTEMWAVATGAVAFRTRAVERDVVVLSQARAQLEC